MSFPTWGGVCFGGGSSFFYPGAQLGAGLLDDLLGVSLGKLLVFLVARNGLLDFGEFGLGDVAALVGPVFPGAEVVVGAVGALADGAERAVFHAGDLEDLFDEVLRSNAIVHSG